MEGKQHGDVVAAIKSGGDETKLLVVDKETDAFFKKCKVIPSHEHLNGELGGVARDPQARDAGRVLDLTVPRVRGDGILLRCSLSPLQGGQGVWSGREQGPTSDGRGSRIRLGFLRTACDK